LFLEVISKTPCHPEGAFLATEGSLTPQVEILRFAHNVPTLASARKYRCVLRENDIFEKGSSLLS